MDDYLELPSANAEPSKLDEIREDEDLSSEDEDEGPDWTKLPISVRPVIPKRGEKDFEPIVQGGSGYQQHVLNRARTAMLDALRMPRTISSKGISYGIWHPEIARVHVTTARGTHFTSMGHSVARAEGNSTQRALKRLELLPEEALYLVERGSLFCWKYVESSLLNAPGLDGMEGSPMTVQQTFAEMIGREDLTPEKYQVYAYLRRLGYVVTRTKPPTSAYPQAAPFKTRIHRLSLLERMYSSIRSLITSFVGLFSRSLNGWRPIRHIPWLHHNMDYPSIFKNLRFLHSGHSVPLHEKKKSDQPPSPYEIFFNVYKPATPFKKTTPPAPDFSMVVVNARTTPMPTLSELTDLFEILPELPPPVPRRRLAFVEQKEQRSTTAANSPSQPIPQLSFLGRLITWIYPRAASQIPEPPRKPNPFAVLKAGKKLVIVAVVDAGTTSFFGFRQGMFEEFPMA
ncbi:unnamed protein product [Somion occarium]|uniref:tRNA-splicing endonuclease subunit Sen54 N-terminal domain-containing protein n=1 Tax=Somion occarium TaxID=3059160 RepID=A0ABP1DX62_9APHY